MKTFFCYSLIVAGLLVGATSLAHADPYHPVSPKPSTPRPDPPPRAPEIDPSLAIGALALLGGTLTVVRARARK